MISHYTNQSIKLLVALTSTLLISACSSTDTTPGTEVHAHMTHSPAAAPPAPGVTEGASSKTITLSSGDTIELTSAYLTISEMDLRTNCSTNPFARLLDTMYELVIPVAHAHTESTPTKIGEPLIVNVLNPDTEELEFGHFSPPPDSYCGITVHMHPADVDSRGLPTTVDMVGKVLHLEGTYTGTSTLTFLINISIEPEHADIVFPAAIELSATNLTGEAHLNIEYNTWFNGLTATDIVDLEADPITNQTALQQLLDNITASIVHE